MRQLPNSGGICSTKMGYQGGIPIFPHRFVWPGPQPQVRRNNVVRNGNREFHLNPNASEFVPSFSGHMKESWPTPEESYNMGTTNGTYNAYVPAEGLNSFAHANMPMPYGSMSHDAGNNCQFPVTNGDFGTDYTELSPLYHDDGNGSFYNVHEEERNSNPVPVSQQSDEGNINVEMVSAVPIKCFPVYGIIGYHCTVPKTPPQPQGQPHILLKVTPSNPNSHVPDTTNASNRTPHVPSQFSLSQTDTVEKMPVPHQQMYSQVPRQVPLVPMQQLQQQAPPLPDVTAHCESSPMSPSEAGNFVTVFIPRDAFGTGQKGFHPAMLPPAPFMMENQNGPNGN